MDTYPQNKLATKPKTKQIDLLLTAKTIYIRLNTVDIISSVDMCKILFSQIPSYVLLFFI